MPIIRHDTPAVAVAALFAVLSLALVIIAFSRTLHIKRIITLPASTTRSISSPAGQNSETLREGDRVMMLIFSGALAR